MCYSHSDFDNLGCRRIYQLKCGEVQHCGFSERGRIECVKKCIVVSNFSTPFPDLYQQMFTQVLQAERGWSSVQFLLLHIYYIYTCVCLSLFVYVCINVDYNLIS